MLRWWLAQISTIEVYDIKVDLNYEYDTCTCVQKVKVIVLFLSRVTQI